MNKEFIEALEELEKDKHVSKEVILDAVEQALVSAYKKNYGNYQNCSVAIDRETGEVRVLMSKDVVADEDLIDDMLEVSLTEAQQIDPRYEIGDVIRFAVIPKDFGRIAAQTAKQVVVQKIREAERSMVYDEFITRKEEIVNGTVSRKSGATLFVSLGSAEGILSANEQVPGETFEVREHLKVYIMDVKNTAKGPQVFLSRSHPGLVKGLFEQEVPEIQDGTMEIRSIAREAGSRTKMAVSSNDENVDPVGACVGTRGSRVQTVVDELSGEKIDIIFWSDDPAELIANVLSPADVEMVIIENEEEKNATAVVPDFQLSLAIGKQGQNVRLAAKVSGWKIDIKSHSQYEQLRAEGAYDDARDYDEEEDYAVLENSGETAEMPEEDVLIAEDPDGDAKETPEEAPSEEAAGEQEEE